MPSNIELTRRKPVWSALSELWLDTELQDTDFARIAQVMHDSEYSIETLQRIYQSEVAPVVYTNLLVPAGVWSGFDDEWLHQAIIASMHSNSLMKRIRIKLTRRLMFYATEQHWSDLVRRVIQLRRRENQ